jgi:tRNA1Val (adenine37-N6)-methyltransferase
MNPKSQIFQFKHFSISQSNSTLKVGTDAMVLGALIDTTTEKSALDIGTGTGVLALMLAQKNATLTIDAIEIDSGSCMDANLNFENSKWKNRLSLIEGDFLTHSFTKKYDLIVSNPPFYVDGLVSENDRNNKAKHSNELNFDSLFNRVNQLLSLDGSFWLIYPFDTHSFVESIANEIGLFPSQLIEIQGKPNRPTRMIACYKKVASNVRYEVFLIRNEDGNYSPSYIEATLEFHSKKIVR